YPLATLLERPVFFLDWTRESRGSLVAAVHDPGDGRRPRSVSRPVFWVDAADGDQSWDLVAEHGAERALLRHGRPTVIAILALRVSDETGRSDVAPVRGSDHGRSRIARRILPHRGGAGRCQPECADVAGTVGARVGSRPHGRRLGTIPRLVQTVDAGS